MTRARARSSPGWRDRWEGYSLWEATTGSSSVFAGKRDAPCESKASKELRRRSYRGDALAKEFQGELGQLLLQSHHFRLQTANTRSESCFFRERGRGISQRSLVLLSEGRGRKRRRKWGDFLPERRRSGGKWCDGASMQGSQLLDLLGRQTFEACIGGMSNEVEMSKTLANLRKVFGSMPSIVQHSI